MATQYAYDAKRKVYYQNDGSGWKVVNPKANAYDASANSRMKELSIQAASADRADRIYKNVEASTGRFKTGPVRAAMMDAALPDEKGGFWDRLGAATIGTALRGTGAITNQNVTDFQILKAQQAERTAERQVEQKGPQTEADAARYMLADISPYKTPDANKAIINQGRRAIDLQKGRSNFAIKFANRYGLNGVDERGRSMEQAFQESLGVQRPTTDGKWSFERVK